MMDKQYTELWKMINRYVSACGGDIDKPNNLWKAKSINAQIDQAIREMRAEKNINENPSACYIKDEEEIKANITNFEKYTQSPEELAKVIEYPGEYIKCPPDVACMDQCSECEDRPCVAVILKWLNRLN